MEIRGAAKVYYSSPRVPISAMLEFSSDLVIILDSERRIIQVNEAVLALLNEKRDNLFERRFDEIDNPFLRDLPIAAKLELVSR
jgi:PAS domain-containing protein